MDFTEVIEVQREWYLSYEDIINHILPDRGWVVPLLLKNVFGKKVSAQR